jgi:hypothetical protein
VIQDIEYIVNVIVVVKTPSEKEARQYVQQHLKGPYTSNINIVNIECKEGKP